MASKKIILTGIIAFILLSSACTPTSNIKNLGWIYNSTDDTVYFYYGGLNKFKTKEVIYPYQSIEICSISGEKRALEYFEENQHSDHYDTVIFCRDNDTILWLPPFTELPLSYHNFFNKNSWDVNKHGKNGKYFLETFTITESDFTKK